MNLWVFHRPHFTPNHAASFLFLTFFLITFDILFSAGNIIFTRIAWSWCRLAVADHNRCYLVKSSITIRNDGCWYRDSNTQGYRLASGCHPRNGPCCRRTRSCSNISRRKCSSINWTSCLTNTCPHHRGFLKRWSYRHYPCDLYRCVWLCPDKATRGSLFQHACWLPHTCNGSHICYTTLEFYKGKAKAISHSVSSKKQSNDMFWFKTLREDQYESFFVYFEM